MTKRKKLKKGALGIFIIILILIGLLIFYFMKEKDKSSNKEETTKTTSLNTTTVKEKTTFEETTIPTTVSSSTTTKKNTTSSVTTKKTTSKNNTSKKTSKGYTISYIDGAYYIDGVLIVNKSYFLDKDWVPTNPYKKIPSDGFAREPLDKDAYNAWKEMLSDSKALGLNLWAQSGYRSFNYQKGLYEGYVSRKGKAAADKSSARAGASEHQSGLAFDLNTITTAFKDTDEGKWVNDNCYLYGYIIRYPQNKDKETGYMYEPWHIRYVGKDLAKKLYNNGDWITLENYFGIDSKYQ